MSIINFFKKALSLEFFYNWESVKTYPKTSFFSILLLPFMAIVIFLNISIIEYELYSSYSILPILFLFLYFFIIFLLFIDQKKKSDKNKRNIISFVFLAIFCFILFIFSILFNFNKIETEKGVAFSNENGEITFFIRKEIIINQGISLKDKEISVKISLSFLEKKDTKEVFPDFSDIFFREITYCNFLQNKKNQQIFKNILQNRIFLYFQEKENLKNLKIVQVKFNISPEDFLSYLDKNCSKK